MKKKIINSCIKFIKTNNKELNKEQIEIIEYGLESIYLTITKIVVIILLSLILNIFKETILMILFYNVIRFFAFGLHTKNSSACLFTSISLFIIGAYLAIYLKISIIIKIILSIVSLILIIIYAPADTEKRPLINKKKRKKFKILSIITSTIMTLLIIFLKDNYITNLMFVGFVEATIMILPITYKLYGVSYNNYKNYNALYN